MKLFHTLQIAEIDKFTIIHEPISDIDLMERASSTVFTYIEKESDYEGKVAVFCGPGNNGGDGLAIARMLAGLFKRFDVEVYILDFDKGLKGASQVNLERLKEQGLATINFITEHTGLPALSKNCLIVDALFGSGLNRPLEGLAEKIVQHINKNDCSVIAVDIPSGLMGEDNSDNKPQSIIRANVTITFQFPKLCFLFPENETYIGSWLVKNIGLSIEAIEETSTNYRLLQETDVKNYIRHRGRFAHKGTFGHALLIAGSYGMMGAAVLSSKACLRAGVGLLSTHLPHNGYQILPISVPEAITSIDESDIMFTSVKNAEKYSAIGIGPGIGTKVNTRRGLKSLIQNSRVPLVLDADALNIISIESEMIDLLPQNTILTPHPKEFDRLAGESTHAYQRLMKAIDFAVNKKVIVVLKGAHTAVVDCKGQVWFNISGNPGMATAGSGDVLTGIILSLLAQGYSPLEAAQTGVYIHGLAGDFAAAERGFEALIASDIIEHLGKAFLQIHKKT